eukprot:16440625-Heterocapsa_arctica.AAC.1
METYPTIFDGLIQGQGTDDGVQPRPTGHATWDAWRAQQQQQQQEPPQLQGSGSADRSRSRSERTASEQRAAAAGKGAGKTRDDHLSPTSHITGKGRYDEGLPGSWLRGIPIA